MWKLIRRCHPLHALHAAKRLAASICASELGTHDQRAGGVKVNEPDWQDGSDFLKTQKPAVTFRATNPDFTGTRLRNSATDHDPWSFSLHLIIRLHGPPIPQSHHIICALCHCPRRNFQDFSQPNPTARDTPFVVHIPARLMCLDV